MYTMIGHTRQIDDLRFSPDGRTLATIGQDGVRCWDPFTGLERLEIESVKRGRSLRFSHDSRHLYVATPRAASIEKW